MIADGAEREIKRWKEMKGNNSKPSMAFSTVGCVAVDAYGNIACATSTEGTPMKKRGRVGDTPIPGAGAMIAKIVCDLIEKGYDVFYARRGGVIAMNSRGDSVLIHPTWRWHLRMKRKVSAGFNFFLLQFPQVPSSLSHRVL